MTKENTDIGGPLKTINLVTDSVNLKAAFLKNIL